MTTFDCTGCGQKLQGRVEWAGKAVRCPRCGALVKVPDSPTIPAAPAAAAISPWVTASSREGADKPQPESTVAVPPSTDSAPANGVAAAASSATVGVQVPAAGPGPVETVHVTTELPPPEQANRLADTLAPRSREAVAGGHAVAIAGYEILDELGRGGMGVVFKARQVHLKRLVALKMILGGAAVGPEEVARFRREAEAVACLQHPNIVQIYEVGEHDGRPFCALEFVSGGSLASSLGGMPQAPQTAAQLVEVLSRAMHAAHERGVIHRDLKPANVLLHKLEAKAQGPEETVRSEKPAAGHWHAAVPKITDFGLAKRLDDDSAQTRSGTIMGTPSYMAPEQAAGKTSEIGAAADTYALGAILYEMLTGRPPFRGESVFETIRMVTSEEPVPPARFCRVPRDLETITLKCLQKDPRQRYASAQALAEDLRRFLDGEPIRARPVGAAEHLLKWAKRRPGVAALSASLLLVTILALAVVTGLWRQTQAALGNEQQARLEEAEARALAEKARKDAEDRGARLRRRSYANEMVLAHDVWETGYVNRVLGRLNSQRPQAGEEELRGFEWYNLWQRCHDHLHIFPGHKGSVRGVVFTPDGKTVASASTDKTVRLWNVDGSIRATLAHPADLQSLALTRDGKLLAAGCGNGAVRIWDLASATPGERNTFTPHNGNIPSLAFSPDGKTLAVAGHVEVKVWDVVAGRQVASLKGHSRHVEALAFSPDGKTLASAGYFGDPTVILWDMDKGRPRTTLRHPDTVLSVAFSPDGQYLATTDYALQLRLWRLPEGEQLRAIALGNFYRSVTFSPDGRTLAAGRWGPNVPGEVKLCEVDTGNVLATIKGHSGGDVALAFSPDGAQLVTGSQDRTVKLWDLQRFLPSMSQPELAMALTFSADRRSLAIGCGKDDAYGLVRCWDLESGRMRAPLAGYTQPVRTVAISPDGTTLAAATPAERTVKLWDLTRGQVRLSVADSAAIHSLEFSPDGKTLAAGSLSRVRLIDPATGADRITPLGHPSTIMSLAFSPDGRMLASGASDKTICLWDPLSGKQLAVLKGQPNGVRVLAFSSDGKRLISGSGLYPTTGEAKIWDVSAGQELADLPGHINFVGAVAFSPDSRAAITGSGDGKVRVWDASTGKLLHTLAGHSHPVLRAAFSSDGKTLLSASRDSTVRYWDAATWQEQDMRSLRSDTWSLAWTPDSRMLYAGSYGSVRVLDGIHGRDQAILRVRDYVSGLAVSPDGRFLASAEQDGGDRHLSATRGVARLWDLATAKELAILKSCPRGVHAVAFTPDGKTLALGLGDRTVSLWDMETRKERAVLKGHDWAVRATAFSRDGRLLAVGCGEIWNNLVSEARLWNVDTGEQVAVFRGHMGPVAAVAFSPDGTLLATGSDDQTVKIWDVASKRLRTTLLGQNGVVRSVSFSPDGKRLATFGSESLIKIWDTGTWQEVASLVHLPTWVQCLSFSPDGRTLAVGTANYLSGKGMVKLWRAAPEEHVPPPNTAR